MTESPSQPVRRSGVPAPWKQSCCNIKNNTHVQYAHHTTTDRCLCGRDEKPCAGECGLEDMSFLPFRMIGDWWYSKRWGA